MSQRSYCSSSFCLSSLTEATRLTKTSVFLPVIHDLDSDATTSSIFGCGRCAPNFV